MNIKIDYAARVGVITLDKGEDLDVQHLDIAVRHVDDDPAGIWNVELILEPRAMNHHVDALRDRRFEIAGNLSVGNVTFIRMRKFLRRSSDGWAAFTNPLAMTPTPIPPSDTERRAVEEMLRRLGRRPEQTEEQ